MPMFGMKRCQLISSCSSSGKLPILFEAKALPSMRKGTLGKWHYHCLLPAPTRELACDSIYEQA